MFLATAAQGAPLPPAAIYTDPPADAAHPARMEVLHIPSGGVEINGVAYLASGAGAHPTVVLFHGLPGNEKNLDLAQAIRRAGWNVVTLNYRGSWGSPGHFSFKGNLADARAALAYVRSPANAAKLGIDTRRLVIMGHSMGGWVTAVTAGADPDLAGAVMISGADISRIGQSTPEQRLALARDNRESLAATAEEMAAEIATLGPELGFDAAAPGLTKHPLLVITSNDGLKPMADHLVMDVKQRGGRVAVVHIPTDHSYSDARIRLQSAVLTWLAALPK
ncbi:alpha/beta hydrolase [Phenylobacterium soli]|uniref:Alpha/beta hydrolase n=2 Tax=Phenylobacterium soli TaxID=2170551 RepID=A0A328ABG1_9CAUL|nr:alpha/beta hydrolase [Phenylobacterium soli]